MRMPGCAKRRPVTNPLLGIVAIEQPVDLGQIRFRVLRSVIVRQPGADRSRPQATVGDRLQDTK